MLGASQDGFLPSASQKFPKGFKDIKFCTTYCLSTQYNLKFDGGYASFTQFLYFLNGVWGKLF